MVTIAYAETAVQISQVRDLLVEYASSLGFNLGFQGFDQELRELPGEYSPPGGRLLIASVQNEVVGCVALRRIDGETCEMKRMYIRPTFRGKGIGRRLAMAIISEARALSYRRMRLDSVPSMIEALALYRSLGFADTEPYRYNPIEGAIFLELALDR